MRTLRSLMLGALLATSAVASVVAPVSVAVAADAATIIDKVEAKYAGVTSMKAKFTQVTRNELFGDETVTGELVVKRPAKMRWSFGSSKLFITDGKKMWIYTAEDKQVIVYDDISSQRATADALLTSMDKIGDLFSITVLSSTADLHVLELKPKKDAQFKKVKLTLDKDFVVKGVVITDTFDSVTELSFSSVQLNASADDSLFTFTPPAGTTVVRGTTN